MYSGSGYIQQVVFLFHTSILLGYILHNHIHPFLGGARESGLFPYIDISSYSIKRVCMGRIVTHVYYNTEDKQTNI